MMDILYAADAFWIFFLVFRLFVLVRENDR